MLPTPKRFVRIGREREQFKCADRSVSFAAPNLSLGFRVVQAFKIGVGSSVAKWAPVIRP